MLNLPVWGSSYGSPKQRETTESWRQAPRCQGWVLKHQGKKVLESDPPSKARGLTVLAAEKGRNEF